jgi:hypothetical protein
MEHAAMAAAPEPVRSETLSSGPKAPAADRLGPLLCRLNVDIQNLKLRVENARALKEQPRSGFNPHQIKVLCGILDRGAYGIGRLLESMGDPNGGDEARESDPDGVWREFDAVEFIAEYRGCCRSLCAALREALRISDASACALLSHLALRLEKHLWLMDPRPHDSDIGYCRNVLLFLAC